MPEARVPGIWLLGAVLAGMLLSAPIGALPGAAEAPVKSAAAALARGDGIAAEAELNRALAAGADKPDVAAAMGEALLDQGKPVRAREWLGPAQFARGSEAYGWRMLGLLERQEGHLAAAGRAYDKALALTPKDPQLWVDIGRMRYVGGEQIQAIQAANRALELGPEHPRAMEFRAQLLRDGGDPAGALALFERGLEAAPDDLDLLGGQAATLGELGRANEMLAVTRRMVELSPRDPYAYYLQAVLAARAGKTDLARAVLNRTGSKLDEIPAAMLLEGLLELETGNAHIAANQLEQLAKRQPANPRVQALLARALYESGEYDRLFERFAPLAARADAPTYLLEVLGRAHEERGDRAAAAPLLDRAASAAARPLLPIIERDAPGVLAAGWRDNPGSPGTAVPYVRSLLSAGQAAQAGQVALRFQTLHPGSYEALVLTGDTDLAAGRPGSALQRYQLASLVRFPDQLLLRICLAYERSGQGDAARPLVARYLASVPQSPMAARLAAGQSAFAGDWVRSRALLESLRKRGGNRDVRLLADLSFAQLRDGDAEAATESAARAWQLQPASPVAAQARAMALAALNRDEAQTRQLLEQARRSGGDNPLLAETRKKLGVH